MASKAEKHRFYKQKHKYMKSKLFRGGFKTQPPVDRRFRPVPGGCHCLEQLKPGGTGRNRRSTGGWVLKPSLTNMQAIENT